MKLEQIPGDYDNVDQRALELLNKVAPWDMEYDGRWQTRDYLARAKANQ
jgi:hypothetical protein